MLSMANNENLVIIDTSVIAHLLAEGETGRFIGGSLATGEYQIAAGVLKAQLGWLASGNWIHLENPDVLWALDSKINGHYWRHDYLTPRGILYKGTRKPSNPRVVKLIDVMKKALRAKGSQVMGVGGYEADDVAAAAVQLLPHKRKILLTVDNDWAGLIGVNGAEMVTAVSSHLPRHRSSVQELNVWAKKRLKTTFNRCSDIWDYKAEHGDSSDNLPPGTPLEVINLLAPPACYNLSLNRDFMACLSNYQGPSSHRTGAACKEYLHRQGLHLVVGPV